MDALISTYQSFYVLHVGEISDPYNSNHLGAMVPCTHEMGSRKLKVGHRERSRAQVWGEVYNEN